MVNKCCAKGAESTFPPPGAGSGAERRPKMGYSALRALFQDSERGLCCSKANRDVAESFWAVSEP